MHRPQPGAGQHSHHRLGHIGHIDDDSVAALHAQLAQAAGKATGEVQQLAVGVAAHSAGNRRIAEQGRLVGAVGSPGGPSILAYNAKALIAALGWGLPVQEAFDLPNIVAKGAGFGADTEGFSDEIQAGMAARGIVLRPNASENSGLHGALWRNGRWDGGADSRREGVARTR